MAKRLSQPNYWVITRKASQAIALIGFLAAIIAAGHTITGMVVLQNILRINPLTTLTQLLASRQALIIHLLALPLVILTLLFGRVWCGWLCPLGTTLDIITPVQPAKFNINPSWRRAKYGLLTGIFFAALLGNLTFLFLDPLTIFLRTASGSLLPILNQSVTALETALYPIPFLSNPISKLDLILRPALLPYQTYHIRGGVGVALFFICLTALNWLAPRFWCRYLCPLGALLGVFSRMALFRRTVSPKCHQCGACAHSCPTGTIDSKNGHTSDPAECTVCLNCIESCPGHSVSFRVQTGLSPKMPYDLNRRATLSSLVSAVTAVSLFETRKGPQRANPNLLRPPGASEDSISGQCIRCSACIQACPTHLLQPAISEAGPEGFWTPVAIPDYGFCDFSCTRCGQVCPTGAISKLDLESKRSHVIGHAYIDTSLCLAWADHVDCIVCEEMCPISDKAIKLTETSVIESDGSIRTLLLPQVERERCIGCGTCEYKCPIRGKAAIRVRTAIPALPY